MQQSSCRFYEAFPEIRANLLWRGLEETDSGFLVNDGLRSPVRAGGMPVVIHAKAGIQSCPFLAWIPGLRSRSARNDKMEILIYNKATTNES